MNTNDGGPAFPTPAVPDPTPDRPTAMLSDGYDGMSLRDYFAAQALPALVCEFMDSNSAWDSYGDVAASAYRIADAMLRERAK